jgi:hypothetical protein
MNRKYIINIIFCYIFLISILISSCLTFHKNEEFNILEWEMNRDERYKMAKNVIKNNILIGKTKNEIIKILGEIDIIYDGNNIRYFLGAKEENIFHVYNIIIFGFYVLDISFKENIVHKVIINRYYNYPKKEFNKYNWEKFVDTRYIMSKSIIKEKILIGKTKDDVINILGTTECVIEQNIIRYFIGYLPTFFRDCPDSLEIIFDEEKAIKVIQRNSCTY